MTAVKICGVVRPEDAGTVTEAGADYVGVILSPGYSRSLAATEAALVLEAAGCSRVGVMVDPDEAVAVGLARELALDVIQLHGSEGPDLVDRIRRAGPWSVWKAVRPGGTPDLTDLAGYRDVVEGVLVDSWHPGAPGGSGRAFAWEGVGDRVRDAVPEGLFVAAGGLRPDTVCQAIRTLRPDVVDVSSGVESEPGSKDPALIKSFIEAAMACGESEEGSA